MCCKCPTPSKTGIYNNIGKFIMAPPIPNIPDIKEPTTPMKKMVIINAISIMMPPLKKGTLYWFPIFLIFLSFFNPKL
jgi:hypothetical protein